MWEDVWAWGRHAWTGWGCTSIWAWIEKGRGLSPPKKAHVMNFSNRKHAYFVAVVRQFCWRKQKFFFNASDFSKLQLVDNVMTWWILAELLYVCCDWYVCVCVCMATDTCCQFTPYNSLPKEYQKTHLSWMLQKNPSGSCLDVIFSYEDHLF